MKQGRASGVIRPNDCSPESKRHLHHSSREKERFPLGGTGEKKIFKKKGESPWE